MMYKGGKQVTWARVGASYEDVSSEGSHWLKHLMGEAGGAFMTSTAARKVTSFNCPIFTPAMVFDVIQFTDM